AAVRVRAPRVGAGPGPRVFGTTECLSWTPSGLSVRSVNALAGEAIHAPVRLIAGSDLQGAGGGLPLFQSLDAGVSWSQLSPPISGTITVKLVAGPLPPIGNVRPLVVGTNTGLFASSDNGASFTPLSG